MENSFNSLLNVSGTMLITLYARARESLSKNPIIIDTKAVEMINIIKKEIVNSQDPIHKKILNVELLRKVQFTVHYKIGN